ncbi:MULTISPECIES: UTP--glucose-1-phosphate uridylyltransferase GalU [Thiomicrorhabdus]|uniref:UTP--glucose-1-phosphate uridylyltransferase n=1 Tax=Thiomicrorhabdus heinhorstiae TaxID=2748010 RepID=A0ABS0BTT3_9GAMM|nr:MULTISPECIES: UTP--glucose-1-phosphate uridylyltransferase GalU [Thiomicrorhabdus]MBF6057247.1 UTP--glucose-1-phosphate uridylyltransferase GalU [Thiomicrorhabdus heinhorstiae]
MKKIVIPVAGLGSRFLPATKAIPKEMITLVDQPLIQYVVTEAVRAGFTDIIFVTHSYKQAIENHFDKNFELETLLTQAGKTAQLQKLADIIPEDINIVAVRQPTALGLGHAVLCAASAIGDDDFAVLLPDVILNEESQDLKNMVEAFKRSGQSQIMVEPVPESEVHKYGIVDCLGHDLCGHDSCKMVNIVEKPKREEAPSNLSVTGRYILDNRILEILKTTPRGAGNEIQLTDAIAQLMDEKGAEAYCLGGKSYDCGDKLGYLKATVQFALKHPELGEEFAQWLKNFEI